MLAVLLWEAEHGGNDITWMLWVALGFFALIVLIGWLSSRGRKANPADQEPEHPTTEKQH